MILDADGVPTDPVVAAGMYDDDPEARVARLRRSILGDEAPPRPTLTGLAAWLPGTPPEGVIDLPFFGLERNPPLVVEVPAGAAPRRV